MEACGHLEEHTLKWIWLSDLENLIQSIMHIENHGRLVYSS